MRDLQAAREKLSAWLEHHLRKAPPEVRVFYVQWNDGWEDYRLAEKGEPQRKLFSIFGFTGIDPADFDPEDPEMIELAEPNWDPGDCCPIPMETFAEKDSYVFFEELLQNTEQISQCLSNRVLAYAMYDNVVKAFPDSRQKNWLNKRFYYALYPAGDTNRIDSYEIGDFDEKPLLRHNQVQSWPENGIRLFLCENAKLMDFLKFYRGWLVCTERVANMFRAVTDKIQVFPVPLSQEQSFPGLFNLDSANYQGNSQFQVGAYQCAGLREVHGYFVVVLFEKVDCISDENVLPPTWEGGPKTYSRGAKIKESVVAGRHVFRLNYTHYQLLVSQEFRDQFEREKVTGVEWVRWPLEEPKSRQPGSAIGRIKIIEEDESHLEDFKEYMP